MSVPINSFYRRPDNAIDVHCNACSHSAKVPVELLYQRFGGSAILSMIRFRCSACDSLDVKTIVPWHAYSDSSDYRTHLLGADLAGKGCR